MNKEDENVFVPSQFDNPDNPKAHIYYTATEILEQVNCDIDGFCSGVGTGGTISGIGEVLKRQNPAITIWAVEPADAAILSGGAVGTHLQMGIGDGLIPENLNTKIYDNICVVSDTEAIETARYCDSIGVNRLSFCPATIHGGTVIERFWRKGAYQPPWIWSCIEIINTVRDELDMPALLDTSGFGSRRGPYNCKKYNKVSQF